MKRKKLITFVIIAALLALSVVGWFIFQTVNKPTAQSATQTQQSGDAKENTSVTNESSDTIDSSIPESETPVKDFNLITDTSNWVARSPRDQSYSMSFGPSETSGMCSDKTDVLMVGMVYMNGNGEYTCGNIKNVFTPASAGTVQLTNIAVGRSDALWDKQGAQPITVTLPQGETAQRYEYSNTSSGVTYAIVQYDITYQGKEYVAIWHWRNDYEPSMPQNYFDTMVQKTLKFN